MLFCTSHLLCSANHIGSFLPQAKDHAAHGKKTAVQGKKITRHLVKIPGHVI